MTRTQAGVSSDPWQPAVPPPVHEVGDSVLCFGSFRLLVRERLLMREDMPVSLGSRAFDLLVALVQRAGETVSRRELLKLVWPDVIVVEANIRVHIAALRKALGDGDNGKRFIVSVASRGYSFIAQVRRVRPVTIAGGVNEPGHAEVRENAILLLMLLAAAIRGE